MSRSIQYSNSYQRRTGTQSDATNRMQAENDAAAKKEEQKIRKAKMEKLNTQLKDIEASKFGGPGNRLGGGEVAGPDIREAEGDLQQQQAMVEARRRMQEKYNAETKQEAAKAQADKEEAKAPAKSAPRDQNPGALSKIPDSGVNFCRGKRGLVLIF